MEYKGYNVSSIEAVILLDILEVQKAILQEIKRINPEPEFIPEEDSIDTSIEQEEKPTKEIQEKEEIKPSVNRSTKPANKKSKAKTKGR